MLKTVGALLGAALLLSACAEGRFIGFNSCSTDGSTVWFERPNAQGSYEGLNNSPANCRTARG